MKNFYFIFEDPNEVDGIESAEGYTSFYIIEKDYYDKEDCISDWHNKDEVLKSIPEEMRDTFEDEFDEIMESVYETAMTPDEIRKYFSCLSCFTENKF